ncbi:MAG: Gfo/Idh/MocA family oxidoreductase [bacterium]|nr:Gfo/Idh/MocA family oxidoreductase [bacterium]
MKKSYSGFSRREFLAGIGAFPFVFGGCASLFDTAPVRRPLPSERVTLAIIGCGTMGRGNMEAFLQDPRVQVVAVCDPVTELKDYGYSPQHRGWGGRIAFKRMVDAHYKNNSCRACVDYREIADDPTIDAVVVTTPDHWHALIAIACMKKGKHVYCQKPMSLGVSEGQEMVRIAKKMGVTFQVGSQQRSASEFRVAAEWIRNGYLGSCTSCEVGLPGGRGPYWGYPADRTPRTAPDYFGSEEMWNLWQGPAEHHAGNVFIPAIHGPMCWRSNSRTGGGMITDWGAHHIDILHWALGVERGGPVGVENFKSDGFGTDPLLDWAGSYSFDLVYANGFRAHVSNRYANGLRFKGEKGEVFVCRGRLDRPEFLKKWNEKKDLGPNEQRLYRPSNGHNHESDFIDGIYENRLIATDCEIGHRSISACHIANICERLGLSALAWNPDLERFTGANAEAANSLLEVKHANGWKLA